MCWLFKVDVLFVFDFVVNFKGGDQFEVILILSLKRDSQAKVLVILKRSKKTEVLQILNFKGDNQNKVLVILKGGNQFEVHF